MSELEEIKRDNGVPQKNSGRGKHDKGDAIYDGYWCVDIKEYPKGFTLNLANWAKVCTDAIKSGNLEPALKVVLGESPHKVRLFVISEDDFNAYRRLREEEQNRWDDVQRNQ